MRTYLLVNIALLPLPLYLLGVWLASPAIGAGIALAYALGWSLFTRGTKRPPVFESALIGGLFLVLADRVVADTPVIEAPTGFLLLVLSVSAAVSVAIRKPWTADFSASAYGGASQTPLFLTVNMVMSAIWAGLFAWLGAAAMLDAPPIAHWVPAVIGAVVSIFLPNAIVAYKLNQAAAGDQRNNWTPPEFSGAPVNPEGEEEYCDVAVIGAGLGGLTAAALLADAGLKVQVFEQHVAAGGYAHTWLRRARVRDPQTGKKLVFRFDSGVHDVSGWHEGGSVRTVFERLGIAGDCEWKRLDHRYVLGGRTISVPRDWRRYAEQLAQHFPHEADGIIALFDDIRDIYDAMYASAPERGGIPGPPTTPEGLMAYAKAHPLAVTWMDRRWSEFVARHIKDADLMEWIGALGDYITDGLDTIRVAQMVPLFGYYFKGGHYPVGGSGAMSESLVKAIERRGGSVHLKTRVLKIIEEDGAAAGLVVRSNAGFARRIQAGAVVCNADLRLMLDGLLDNRNTSARLEAQTGTIQPACSAIAVHLGLRGKLDLPPVVHVDGDGGGAGLVIPSAVDPSCAPEGYSTLEIMRLVSLEDARSWFPGQDGGTQGDLGAYRRSTGYLERKQAVCDELVACARQVIPDLDERIVYRTDASPVTYHRYTETASGSIYGVTTGESAVPAKMPLRNLVVAGAATHGPGVEAVVISGAYAAEALVPGILKSARNEGAAMSDEPDLLDRTITEGKEADDGTPPIRERHTAA